MRTSRRTIAAILACLGAFLAVPQPTQAVPITYEFSVDIDEGEFLGQSMSGWFTFDSSIIPSGGTGDLVNRAGIGLFDFFISYGRFTYDESEVDASFMRFAAGELIGFVVGAEVNGIKSLQGGTNDFFVDDVDFIYTTVGMDVFETGYGAPVFFRRVASVPEPAASLLFVTGLLGLAGLGRWLLPRRIR